VDLGQEQLALVDAAGSEAGDAQQVERVEVVGIRVRERLHHLDGARMPALRDQDLAEVCPRLAIVRVVQEHEAQASPPVEVGDGVRDAPEETERVPVGDGIGREQDRGGSDWTSGQHPEDGKVHPIAHGRRIVPTVPGSGQLPVVGPGGPGVFLPRPLDGGTAAATRR